MQKRSVPVTAARAIGQIALAALTRPGYSGFVCASVTAVAYLNGDDGLLLWIGGPGVALHRRGVLVEETVPAVGSDERFICDGRAAVFERGASVVFDGARPWHEPTAPDSATVGWEHMGAAVSRTISQLPLLEGGADDPVPLPFFGRVGSDDPGADGSGIARGGSRAIARDVAALSFAGHPMSALSEATELAGTGAGLTPSGDDFLGGLCFSYWHLARRQPEEFPARSADIEGMGLAASFATSELSGTLLRDLACGHGPAPLHDLVNSFIGADSDRALVAAQKLVGIGSSTGKSMLAGVIAALMYAVGQSEAGRIRGSWAT